MRMHSIIKLLLLENGMEHQEYHKLLMFLIWSYYFKIFLRIPLLVWLLFTIKFWQNL